MILSRKRSFFKEKEKLFTSIRNLDGDLKTFFADIIKILVMGDRCHGDISHWLQVSSDKYGSLMRNKYLKPYVEKYGLGVLGVGFFSNREVEKQKLTNLRGEIKQKTPQEYFEYLWKEVYEQDIKGDPKYKHLMNSTSDPYVLDQLWFVMCNFTGQAGENSNPWEFVPGRVELKIRNPLRLLNPRQFKEKLKSIIFQLRPDIESACNQ